MFDRFCPRAYTVLTASFVLIASSLVVAGEPLTASGGSDDATPVGEIGCGKARAMLVGQEQTEADGGGVAAEPLEATDVLHYALDIEITNINPGSNTCTITGQNRITLQSKIDGLTTFTFRLRNQYTVTSLLIDDVTPITFTTDSITTRVATLDRAYALNEVFTITVAYTGNTTSVGFGSFEVDTHGGQPVVSTLSEPYYSYTWWPVKDGDVFLPGDNSDKATADIFVTVPNTMVVASNGLLQGTDVLSGNRLRYRWSTSYPMVTYLAAFSASNYTKWTANYVCTGGTMPVEFYIYPENDTPTNRTAWERVIDMLEVFGDAYGLYPFIDEKYGIYNFPFGGGMEHQTMTGQCCFSESLSAHELAHQWWGDAVTCRTWGDIWLNEGFATFSECLWEEFKNGTDNLSAYHTCINARKPGDVGDSVYVYDTSSVNRIFSGTFSYLKGAWVLHQLRGAVGDETFFQILADYRAAYEGSAATTDEFAAIASATSGRDLTTFFDQWVYQIGAPAYSYKWDSVKVADQDYLHVTIDQTQSASYPAVFVMPVQLDVTVGGVPTTLAVQNTLRSQRFVIPVDGAVNFMQFDPQQWILRTAVVGGTLIVGDMNADLDVDRHDHTTINTCLHGPGVTAGAGCDRGDFDGDHDVDMIDWLGFQAGFTGCITGCP